MTHQERRRVSRVADFNSSVRLGTSADQGGVLRRQSAFAKHAAGMSEHVLQGYSDGNQRAKHGVQVRHEHGSSDSLAGDVAHHEIKAGIRRIDNIAVIAADDSDGLVMIGKMPSAALEV